MKRPRLPLFLRRTRSLKEERRNLQNAVDPAIFSLTDDITHMHPDQVHRMSLPPDTPPELKKQFKRMLKGDKSLRRREKISSAAGKAQSALAKVTGYAKIEAIRKEAHERAVRIRSNLVQERNASQEKKDPAAARRIAELERQIHQIEQEIRGTQA